VLNELSPIPPLAVVESVKHTTGQNFSGRLLMRWNAVNDGIPLKSARSVGFR
jgi:hypothetical protein